MSMKTITVIVTGGMSRRMGRDKGNIVFEGDETMLSRLIRRYTDVFDGLYISVNQKGRFATGGIPELVDLHPGQGPMAGLEAAFSKTDAAQVFLTAVDLPFGEPALAQRLRALKGDAAACVIQRADGRPESLFAVYDRACLPHITACLEEGKCSFRALFDRVPVRYVQEAELAEFPLDHVLLNVNRPADLEQAMRERKNATRLTFQQTVH
ncbi:MAG: molybdenum cofactor guanylyltransferase [Oscillospiraceae bacterium]|nr:molybdenum cofactor guanylyltransferase [Oscillospiraceae bacterium]